MEKGLRAVDGGCAKVDTSYILIAVMTTDKRRSLRINSYHLLKAVTFGLYIMILYLTLD